MNLKQQASFPTVVQTVLEIFCKTFHAPTMKYEKDHIIQSNIYGIATEDDQVIYTMKPNFKQNFMSLVLEIFC